MRYSQFAKHFKVAEQVEFLKKNRTGIAVGTPTRLMDLLDNGEQPPSLMSSPQRGLQAGFSNKVDTTRSPVCGTLEKDRH